MPVTGRVFVEADSALEPDLFGLGRSEKLYCKPTQLEAERNGHLVRILFDDDGNVPGETAQLDLEISAALDEHGEKKYSLIAHPLIGEEKIYPLKRGIDVYDGFECYSREGGVLSRQFTGKIFKSSTHFQLEVRQKAVAHMTLNGKLVRHPAGVEEIITRLQAEGPVPEKELFETTSGLRISSIIESMPPIYEVKCADTGFNTLMTDVNAGFVPYKK